MVTQRRQQSVRRRAMPGRIGDGATFHASFMNPRRGTLRESAAGVGGWSSAPHRTADNRASHAGRRLSVCDNEHPIRGKRLTATDFRALLTPNSCRLTARASISIETVRCPGVLGWSGPLGTPRILPIGVRAGEQVRITLARSPAPFRSAAPRPPVARVSASPERRTALEQRRLEACTVATWSRPLRSSDQSASRGLPPPRGRNAPAGTPSPTRSAAADMP